VQSPDFVLSEV